MLLLLKGSFTDGEIVPLTLSDRVRPGISCDRAYFELAPNSSV